MRVIILCKAPIAGRVKTRLMPDYSATEAAEIHQLMLNTVLHKVSSVFQDIWLAADDITHPYFQEMKLKYRFNLCYQGSGDLGNRLKYLMNKSFSHDDGSVMFLGTDSPHVSTSRYLEAVNHLKRADVVIGPVEDGGYDLILLSKPFREIFEGITWGSKFVCQQTIAICKKHHITMVQLSLSFDLDRSEDLDRAPPAMWK